jgi:hypothetical protein
LGDLGGNENALAKNCAYASVLEDSGTAGNGTWIRRCHFIAGKDDGEARDDRVMTLMME